MQETPMPGTPMTDTPMPENPPPMPMDETPTLDSNDGALPGVGTTPPMPQGEAPMPQGETPMPQGETPMPPGETPMPMPTDPPASDPPATNPPSTESIPPATPPDNPPSDTAPPDTAPPMTETPMPPAGEAPAPTPMPMPDPAAPPDNATTPMPMPEGTDPPSDFPPPPAATPMPESAGVGPKSNKKFAIEQVNQAITAAHQSAQAWQTAPADLDRVARNKLLADYFRNFATLGEAISLVDDKPENAKTARAAAITAVQEVANSMPKLNQIGKVAGYWIKRTDRTTDGIVLAGRIQETKPVGKLFVSKLLMTGHDQPSDAEIQVVTAEEPTVKQGEVAVLLGMIVGAPSINIHDYEGTEDSIIWASAIAPAQLEGTP
jgi:hypothetical protein